MQEPRNETDYFFVDESGDTTFYNKKREFIVGQEGCSKILIMGFIKTKDPDNIRFSLKELRNELVNDPYLKDIPSMKKTALTFHAKDDCPEVRQAVYKKLPVLDFTAQLIVARKTKKVITKFNNNPNALYDHLITQLFRNSLHKTYANKIYFATRGNRKRQEPLKRAIDSAVSSFEQKWETQVRTRQEVFAQTPLGEPCLQVIDYINWAVYRAYTTGEMRFFNTINEKVRLLVDIYDYKKRWTNFYKPDKNPFDVNKISPL